MRIISGTSKGLKLRCLDTDDIRPTTDRVKQSIFNTIQYDISGSKVLDLFAGTGQLGIESLSRGANFCTFVDFSKKSINVVKENLIKSDFLSKSELLNFDFLTFLKSNKKIYDIIFLDPPYRKGFLNLVLDNLSESTCKDSILICEHSKEEIYPEIINFIPIYRVKNYGNITVTIYKR